MTSNQETIGSCTKSRKTRGIFNEKGRFLLVGILIGYFIGYLMITSGTNAEDSRMYAKCQDLVGNFVEEVNKLVNGPNKYTYAIIPAEKYKQSLKEFLHEYNQSFEQNGSGD